MNTYIQDRLDAFDKQFGKAGEERNCDSIGRWAGCDDCEENIELRDEHRKFNEQSLTDYHNHIVEKINSIDPTKSNNAIDHHIKIKSLLQVITPKE